jgi:hypothetical protein
MEGPSEKLLTVMEDPGVPERVLLKFQLPAVCDRPTDRIVRLASRIARPFFLIDAVHAVV